MKLKSHQIRAILISMLIFVVIVPNALSRNFHSVESLIGNSPIFSQVHFIENSYFYLDGIVEYDQLNEILYVLHSEEMNTVDSNKNHRQFLISDIEKIYEATIGRSDGYLYLFARHKDNSHYIYVVDMSTETIVNKFLYEVPDNVFNVSIDYYQTLLEGMALIGSELALYWSYTEEETYKDVHEILFVNTTNGEIDSTKSYTVDTTSWTSSFQNMFSIDDKLYLVIENELREYGFIFDPDPMIIDPHLNILRKVEVPNQTDFSVSPDGSKIFSTMFNEIFAYDVFSLTLEKTLNTGLNKNISFLSMSHDNEYVVAITSEDLITQIINLETNEIEVLNTPDDIDDSNNDGFYHFINSRAWLTDDYKLIGYGSNSRGADFEENNTTGIAYGNIDYHMYYQYEKFRPSTFVYLPAVLKEYCSVPIADNFSNPDSGWREGMSSYSGTTWAYVNNEYSIFMPNDEWWALDSRGEVWRNAHQFSLDGRVERNQGYWGLMLNLSQSESGHVNFFEVFEINPATKQWRYISISPGTTPEPETVIAQGSSSFIKAGSQMNRLTLDLADSVYTLKINGITVHEIGYDSLFFIPFENNGIGLFARSISEDVDVRFDNYYFAKAGCEKEDLSGLAD